MASHTRFDFVDNTQCTYFIDVAGRDDLEAAAAIVTDISTWVRKGGTNAGVDRVIIYKPFFMDKVKKSALFLLERQVESMGMQVAYRGSRTYQEHQVKVGKHSSRTYA